jgi:very-short-patch-repair endonuclease
MTGVELLLWSRLRRQQLEGHRFRRQAPIGPYKALPRERVGGVPGRRPGEGAACFQARLLIEIDGPSHDDRVEYDRRRTAWLVRGGFRVLRFAADDVLSRLDDVLETILWELADSVGPPSPCKDCEVSSMAGMTHPPPGSAVGAIGADTSADHAWWPTWNSEVLA